MGTLSRTWSLAKASWSVINHDRELLFIPIISAVVSLIVAAVFVVPMVAMGTDDGSATGLMFILAVLLVMALTAVSVVFQGALVSGAHERFTGGDPTISSAIGGAVSKMHRLIPWAILTATVGLILRMVREEMGFIGRILSSLLDTAWQVLTYLVVPVVMFEDRGPIDGVKRSTQLFKGTWGENLAARVGFGLLGFVAMIPAFAIFALGASVGLWPLFIVAVLWAIAVAVVLTAMNAVFQTALYLYATSGNVPSGFSGTDFTHSFGPK
ncbi:MAG: DUF6159 family protein [Actinomycetota bacterium]|nr:DUF6159 family protein [Actinomycetota bacterium]